MLYDFIINSKVRHHAYTGNINYLKELADAGADLSHNNNEPLRIAIREGNIKFVQSMLLMGVCPNIGRGLNNPLATAIRFGQLEAVKLLLRYNALTAGLTHINIMKDRLCKSDKYIECMELAATFSIIQNN